MEYVSIRVSTLRGDQAVEFDAYIKINDKYVLYVRKGDSFEGDRLTRLKSKKLKKMFISPEHENSYRDYMARNIEMAYDHKSGKSIVTRAEIVQGVQQSNAEKVFENSDSVEAYSEAKDAAGRYVQFLTSHDEALKSVLNIENVDQNIAHHGVTVSSLAVALASKLGINDPKQTQLLALGSLLHDFGHFNSDLAINRPVKSFTNDELRKYYAHPQVGAENVRTKKHFDASVINIILEHEEYIDGTGFPNKKMQKDMDPLSVIVASANALDRMITFEGVPRQTAVKELLINAVGRYPLDYIKILSDVLAKSLA
jgi:putative nucleotidyltransferase with HDIG domain